MLEWYFRGFADELSPQLRYITPLPKKPSYYMTQYGVNYNPEWLIRVNVDHILGDEENPSRLPAALRDARGAFRPDPADSSPAAGASSASRIFFSSSSGFTGLAT